MTITGAENEALDEPIRQLRGNPIHFDESTQLWRYSDDDSSVADHHQEKPCGKCGEARTEEEHDPCIANLPGVMNACCGHGHDEAWVQFEDGRRLGGASAILAFETLKRGRDK